MDRHWRMTEFQEKPSEPSRLPGSRGLSLASMGNYIFTTHILKQVLEETHNKNLHDFGHDIIPYMVDRYKVFAYDFRTNHVPGMMESERGYWRDVGHIESYYEANMDLRQVSPIFNLHNDEWPIRTAATQFPPAKFLYDTDGRRGIATDSLVSEGCVISGASVQNSILSPNVFVHSYCDIKDSIVMSGVNIGRGCRIRNAIIDKYVDIPEGEVIGYDLEQDRSKYFVTPSGLVVIAKHTQISHDGEVTMPQRMR